MSPSHPRSAAVVAFSVACIVGVLSCGNTGGDRIGGPKDYFRDARMIELAKAIHAGDLDQLERLVAEGADLNARGRKGATPLGVAMMWLQKDAFRRLLELGANPNLLTPEGASVMHLAAVAEDSDWLLLALSHGGDPNLIGSQGKTPIFEAISAFRPESVRVLLTHGADSNHRDSTGDPPLLHAAGLNRYDLVYILLEDGADYRLKDNWGGGLTDMIARSHVSPGRELYEWRQKVIEWLERRGERIEIPEARPHAD